MKSKVHEFDEWGLAFSLCRELDRPLAVSVKGETGTVFPSGRFRPQRRTDDRRAAGVPA